MKVTTRAKGIAKTHTVAYDMLAVGSTAISVHDGLNPYYPGGSPIIYPLQGQYSIMLQNGSVDGISPQDAWISQTGDIPSTARSLMFSTDWMSVANLVVSLNGITIPTSLYSVGPAINANDGPVQTYIGDVSAFSGQQDVVLRFETVPTGSPYLGSADLDAITFSTTAVPEPSTLTLFAISAVATWAYFLRRRRFGGN
jgi:hypothetical protein